MATPTVWSASASVFLSTKGCWKTEGMVVAALLGADAMCVCVCARAPFGLTRFVGDQQCSVRHACSSRFNRVCARTCHDPRWPTVFCFLFPYSGPPPGAAPVPIKLPLVSLRPPSPPPVTLQWLSVFSDLQHPPPPCKPPCYDLLTDISPIGPCFSGQELRVGPA